MQSTSIESNESIALNQQIYRVTVLLEPITENLWYEMKREQQNLPILSEADKRSCAFCLEEFQSTSTYAKCLDCEQAEVLICIECLRFGMESHPHTRKHRYILCDSIGPVLFDDGPNSWGAQEELQLLNSLLRAHLNQWPELSKDWGRKRTLTEALDHLDRCFIRDEIGHYVLNKYSRGYVKEWENEQNDDCAHQPSTSHASKNDSSIFETISRGLNNCTAIAKEEEEMEEPPDSKGIEKDPILNGNATPNNSILPSQKRRNCFDDEESSEDCFYEVSERRMSTRSGGTEKGELSNSAENRKSRREQLLATAKNVAAEALRGKARKTSLELSEAINFEGAGTSNGTNNKKKQSKHAKKVDEILTTDQLASLYAEASFSPHFYNSPPPPMDAHTASKFDEEDLQLLTFLPFRGEFEQVKKGNTRTRQLITRIVFPREDAEHTEVDRFLDEVRYARFNRYNRIMRIRAAKRGTILEHKMLAEFLNIVKANMSERGKYLVFDDRYFASKSNRDYFRPLFFQIRQIADRETVNQLAKNVGAMEALKEQIEEITDLQRKGITKLKGRLKTDSTSTTPVFLSRSKKRKIRKSENVEQKKAGLRWKRIKRWTKKNQHLQHFEADGSPQQRSNSP